MSMVLMPDQIPYRQIPDFKLVIGLLAAIFSLQALSLLEINFAQIHPFWVRLVIVSISLYVGRSYYNKANSWVYEPVLPDPLEEDPSAPMI